MSFKEIQRLAPCITAHAWNGDLSKVAICPNTNEIHIYARQGGKYTLEHKLTEHDQVVTGIDWAPKSNRIVTCSQDRNAYVWTFKDNQWKPVLVILRINRAATHCKWSPDENKFAVASGAKCVSVCYFEEDNDWWVSKHIKKHKSTVLSIDWHPNNILLATSSSDFKVRVFGAHIKGVDKAMPNTPFGAKANAFGEPVVEIDTPYGGWAHAVKWAPNGNGLAFVSHDSTFTFADLSSGNAQVSVVKHNELPFIDLIFVNDNSVVAVGHDANPTTFVASGKAWKLGVKIDDASASSSSTGPAKGPSALGAFKNKVDKGSTGTEIETTLNTHHQNAITKVSNFGKGQFSTSGLDGNMAIWDNPK
jgi:actin related protein 2/3 complex subunit 1A/1B